jgi:hypothetical protein
MDRSRIRRSLTLSAQIVAAAALALPLASQAAAAAKAPVPGRPLVSTGSVTHVRGTSAQLEGVVDPRGAETAYYFQYGPTVAYGQVSATAQLPAGYARVKVGTVVTGLALGDHYRLVATNSYGIKDGKDRIYSATKLPSRSLWNLPAHPEPTVYGEAYVLSGNLTGVGNANRPLALQASRYPYLAPFANVGVPAITNAAGHFSFRVPDMTANTKFRVATVGPRPGYSPVYTEHVLVRVTLHVRKAGPKGLVRLYGTVTPAEVGARLLIQLRKPVRAVGKSGATTKFGTQFRAIVRSATKTISRFSTVVLIRHQGRYRAYVEVNEGLLSSGTSASVVLGAAPPKPKPQRKQKSRRS